MKVRNQKKVNKTSIPSNCIKTSSNLAIYSVHYCADMRCMVSLCSVLLWLDMWQCLTLSTKLSPLTSVTFRNLAYMSACLPQLKVLWAGWCNNSSGYGNPIIQLRRFAVLLPPGSHSRRASVKVCPTYILEVQTKIIESCMEKAPTSFLHI